MDHSDDSAGRFPPRVAGMLAAKYGFYPQHVRIAKSRALAVLAMLDGLLADGPFLIGGALTAADIYWATFANLLAPLPEAELPALPLIREAYTSREPDLTAALSTRLRDHQRHVYERYLELPVPL